jgi:hypothetical protein
MPDLLKLRRAIDVESGDALGGENDELNQERAISLDYYLGRPMGTEIEGRSQIVSHDVADTVEWQKPALLRIFAGGDQVVKFKPTGPEDVKAAEQETDYINFVLTQKNDWFTFCYDWITDSLLTRNSYALSYWDENIQPTVEGYQGLTDDQLAYVLKDIEQGRVEVLAHSAYPSGSPMPGMDPMTGQPILLPPPALHDLQIRKITGTAFAKVCVLPPERCKVSQRTQEMSLQHSPYFEYWDMKPISELREMGLQVPDDISGADANETEQVDQARNVGDILQNQQLGKTVDPSMRRVKVRMIWIRHDYNEDGIAELCYVIRVGNEILHLEECDTLPVACIVPTIMPHRHVGLSTADNTHDIQDVKTMLVRGLIDNLFLANNGQYGVTNKVNLEDMLTSRPGGIKRIDSDAPDAQGHIFPFQHPVVIPQALQGLEYMDQMREARTGTSRYTQGQDLNALNRTALGIAQLSSAASQRLELIARVIASGMKELFRIVHEITLKHSRMAETVQLRNEWVSVDPRQWKKRTDMSVAVGIGVANREQSIAQLDLLFQRQVAALQLNMGCITPDNVFNTLSELTKALGFAAPDRFVTNPIKNPPKPPQPDPIEVEKLKIASFDAQTKRLSAVTDSNKAKQEPAENARDRKLDLVLAMMQTPKPVKGEDGETKPAPAPTINVNIPELLSEHVHDVADELRTELDQNTQALLQTFGQNLEQVRQVAQKKRTLVPVRGKRGRIERLEEAP